jgi:hypothetical protein
MRHTDANAAASKILSKVGSTREILAFTLQTTRGELHDTIVSTSSRLVTRNGSEIWEACPFRRLSGDRQRRLPAAEARTAKLDLSICHLDERPHFYQTAAS